MALQRSRQTALRTLRRTASQRLRAWNSRCAAQHSTRMRDPRSPRSSRTSIARRPQRLRPRRVWFGSLVIYRHTISPSSSVVAQLHAQASILTTTPSKPGASPRGAAARLEALHRIHWCGHLDGSRHSRLRLEGLGRRRVGEDVQKRRAGDGLARCIADHGASCDGGTARRGACASLDQPEPRQPATEGGLSTGGVERDPWLAARPVEPHRAIPGRTTC